MKTVQGGIYTALFTPFDGAESVNHDTLRNLVRLNRLNGISRFYVCGSSSEMTLLSVGERKEMLRTVLSEKPDYCIAHVGSQNFHDSTELARDASSAGADAVSSVVPFYYKYTIDETAYYYAKLADASGLPVVLYNIPSLSGVDLSEKQLETLIAPEHIRAVKFTSRDLYLLERVKRAYPEKTVLNGCDEVLFSGLAAGADGAIGATYNIMPDKASALYMAWQRSDNRRCRCLQTQINDVISLILPLTGRKGARALLRMKGFDVGESRQPFLPLTREQLDTLRQKALPLITMNTDI